MSTNHGDNFNRVQRRIEIWDSGVAEFDAELRDRRSTPHPFRALKGCEFCLDCGARADDTIRDKHRGVVIVRRIHYQEETP